MDGYSYESTCAQYLKKKGFSKVKITPKSGDQGIDIIAYKDEIKYGFQCKHYSQAVGNSAVQQAFAGAKYYNCSKAVVMTNSTFTKSARDLADQIDVELWENLTETDLASEPLNTLDLVSKTTSNSAPEESSDSGCGTGCLTIICMLIIVSIAIFALLDFVNNNDGAKSVIIRAIVAAIYLSLFLAMIIPFFKDIPIFKDKKNNDFNKDNYALIEKKTIQLKKKQKTKDDYHMSEYDTEIYKFMNDKEESECSIDDSMQHFIRSCNAYVEKRDKKEDDSDDEI